MYFVKKSEYFYDVKNFTGALENSELAEKYYNGAQSDFMQGLSYFGQKNYQKAAEEFAGLSELQNITNELLQKSNFNLANTKYFLGEQSENKEDKIKMYQESIDAYNTALALGEDKEIESNKQYVQKKLDELQQNSHDIPQSDSQNSSEDTEKSTQSQSSSGSTSQGTNSGSLGNNFSTGSSGGQDMTLEEQRYLEQYEEFLQQLQSKNQDAFNKVNPSGNSGDIFDLFTNDPFFQSLPNTTTQDW